MSVVLYVIAPLLSRTARIMGDGAANPARTACVQSDPH